MLSFEWVCYASKQPSPTHTEVDTSIVVHTVWDRSEDTLDGLSKHVLMGGVFQGLGGLNPPFMMIFLWVRGGAKPPMHNRNRPSSAKNQLIGIGNE